MSLEQDLEYLRDHLSLHIKGVLPVELCGEMIARYDDAIAAGRSDDTAQALIDECRNRIFSGDVKPLLDHYFETPYQPLWSSFTVTDSSAATTNYSTRWHLDGGVINTHKLFIYLNPVAEHGGNTVMVDVESTRKLLQAGELPSAITERKEDLGEVFAQLGINDKLLAYDLNAGDALLFDPLTLAHRCLPPREGEKRYTVCFTLVPTPS